MVFDGAAYYGLPNSAQASSSGSQWQAPYGGLQQGLPNHSANAGQGFHGNKTGSRSIIQRPYSYDAPQQQPNMMGQYTAAAGWPAYPQQWQGQVMQNGQVWQRPSPQQPFYGTMHAYGQQYMQNAGLLQQQPLPPSTPAPSLPPPPPPVMRHALPAKPQFAPAGGGQPASLPKQSMPAVLQPMRPITDQRSPDHRPPRPPPIQDNAYSRPRASQNMFCQVCKMSFPSSIHLIAHQRNEHVKCCKHEEGCEFEALPNIVEIHEQDRHLIFRPGARKEKTKPDGPLK